MSDPTEKRDPIINPYEFDFGPVIRNPPDMVDIATASMFLSSFANTGKLIEYAMLIGKGVRQPSVDEARKEANDYAAARVSHANLQQIAASSINDKIRQKIKDVIDDTGVEIIDLISSYDKLPPGAADRRLKAAREKFCWGLHQYKSHNGGVLPPDMASDWDDNTCGSYSFI